MPSSTNNGKYGDMPDEVLLAKYEQTDILEDTSMDKQYQYSVLKDLRPDKPLFESDQPRKNVYSGAALSMRESGGRSNIFPNHADMFLGFTDRDPRGMASDPDMRKYDEQRKARGKYIRFYTTDDNSVVTGEKAPQTLRRQMNAVFYDIKQRLKIFTTSKDSMYAAANYRFAKSSSDKITDQRGMCAAEEIYARPRRDHTTSISNETAIGDMTTTDSEFLIASYGMNRKTKTTLAGRAIASREFAKEMKNIIRRKKDKISTERIQGIVSLKNASDETLLRYREIHSDNRQRRAAKVVVNGVEHQTVNYSTREHGDMRETRDLVGEYVHKESLAMENTGQALPTDLAAGHDAEVHVYSEHGDFQNSKIRIGNKRLKNRYDDIEHADINDV